MILAKILKKITKTKTRAFSWKVPSFNEKYRMLLAKLKGMLITHKEKVHIFFVLLKSGGTKVKKAT